ncbi:four-carbon acid sugar kinase family protein [Pectinatus haikarae]|uniref:four-carbon acid sugar kinase family protein n=1 Tax=Pectinatus haikarae TaxID=349096 RepID=UPI0018C52FE8|nr:four-carbon acid sugar kinase family protein [Pectinatus haikarae]
MSCLNYRLIIVGMVFAYYIDQIDCRVGDVMTKLAVIADDLTGANDTAVQFAKRHMRSFVKLDIDKLKKNESDVLVIDSDSRDLCPKDAYDKVKIICTEIAEQGISCIYKKIDSTMRGNVGIEIKAAADVLKPKLIIIAPAYPENNRITLGGYHLLDGIPLEYTEMAHAPKTPINNSYIPAILQQQVDEKIGLIELLVINKGKKFIKEKIDEFAKKNIKWLVCDAVRQSDFAVLTEALKGYENILWAGSAGLAEYLNDFYGWQGNADAEIVQRNGPVLIVAGSVSHITQKQIEYAAADENIKIVKLDISAILTEQENERDKTITKIKKLIAAKNNILVTAAVNDKDVTRAMWMGTQCGLEGKEVSERTACFLAEIVSKLELGKLAGMILTGGDTAVHICRAIGADAIEIIKEIDSGVPLGRLCGDFGGMFVVTKAGAFGKPEIFVKAISAIKNTKNIKYKSGGIAK